MRKKVIAGNWKMYKNVDESIAFVQAVKGKIDTTAVDTIICAPFTNLPALVETTKGTGIKVGAQNMHWEDEGAYTGEVSGKMLQQLGVSHVIIGHSERRAYFAETDETVWKKVHAAFRYQLVPIVCVGEHLEEREQGKTEQVCEVQVEAALRDLTAEQAVKVIIAYEPIWAIGTGKSSSAKDANDVISFIRSRIAKQFGDQVADKVRIQYGGSVKPDNIGDYLAESDIDGALVGGASLEPESFIQLVSKGV